MTDVAWVDELQGQFARTETVADIIVKSFGITKLGDYRHVQDQVLNTLSNEGFFDDEGRRTDKNDSSGMVVEINESGIDETFSKENFSDIGKSLKLLKLATIREVPNAIKNGVLEADNVANAYSNEVMSLDILHSVNAKTEPAGSLSPELSPQSGGSLTGTTISISDFVS